MLRSKQPSLLEDIVQTGIILGFKIILKVDSEAKLQALSREAFAQGINPAKIYDAGKT
jgi:peptidyl-tRNA hydrolase